MFLEQQKRRMGMTWHSGIESTVVFLCTLSVKIIDVTYFWIVLYILNKVILQIYYHLSPKILELIDNGTYANT
jgi:hypothetical protein